ncbi:MAG: 16S rRNA (guanine(966)-N(2))-methyltransferase RsmD [Pseudomonadota bacterium]
MRIIGGSFRGRRLASVGKGDAAAHLRPTSDRVRESLFNIIESNHADALDGAIVLDVFAGTGALGLEALSRGADHVTFIDQGRAALKLLHANIATCGAEGATRVVPRDARKPGPAAQPASLIFLDPPYGKALGERALAALAENDWIAPGALIIWEDNAPVVAPPSFTALDERRYGDTVIKLYEQQG